MKRSLILFAKEPQRGKVKTRLKGYLSSSGHLNLYKAFLKDEVELIKKIKSEDRILAFDSFGGNPAYLKKIADGFLFHRQKGANLGEKMHDAFSFAFKNGASKMIIIGSDSPNLPGSHIKEAFDKLEKNDLVLGPAYDGGFYLIGLKKPCLEIFRGVKWSTNTVFEHTLRNASTLGKKTAILDKWYDIDEPADLMRLYNDLRKNKSKSVAQCTRNLLVRMAIV